MNRIKKALLKYLPWIRARTIEIPGGNIKPEKLIDYLKKEFYKTSGNTEKRIKQGKELVFDTGSFSTSYEIRVRLKDSPDYQGKVVDKIFLFGQSPSYFKELTRGLENLVRKR